MTILERQPSSSPAAQSSEFGRLQYQQHMQQTAATSAAASHLTTSASAASVASMISSMGDRYITPEYLAPLPPTSSEKSGKSPLQLLAQTCSQIGADTGSNKLLAEKQGHNHADSKKSSSARSPNLVVSDAVKPVSFKPYETNSSSKSGGNNKHSSVISLSPTGSTGSSSGSSTAASPKTNGKSPSPTTTTSAPTKDRHITTTSSSGDMAPVIRSGMEVLAGHPKDLPLGTFRFPSSSMDPHANPAFRSPFGGLTGYPPTTLAASLAASVCRDPYCRDPSCPTAIYNAQLAAALSGVSGLPPGYAELLQAQKLGFGLPGMPPTSLAAAVSAASGGGGGPYVCNWMNGREGYCGKRHNSAEELLQHLRTHTNLSTTDSAALMSPSLYPPGLFSMAGSAGSSAVAAAAAGLHRTYGAGSALGGLASNRFHPYGKPAGMGSALPPTLGLGALGLSPHGLPPGLAGLGAAGAAYSQAALYALYGSRLAGSMP